MREEKNTMKIPTQTNRRKSVFKQNHTLHKILRLQREAIKHGFVPRGSVINEFSEWLGQR